MLLLTYAYNVQVHQATKLPLFGLAITLLPLVTTAIAHPMPLDVSKIDSFLLYKLFPVHRAALRRKMEDRNYRNPPVWYRNDHDKQVQFKLRFAVGEHVFEDPHANAICCIPHGLWRISQAPASCIELYQAMRIGLDYVNMDQEGIQNSISINCQSRVTEEERTKMEIKSDSKANSDTNPVKNGSIVKETDSYTVENAVGHENGTTGAYYTVR